MTLISCHIVNKAITVKRQWYASYKL